jgi:hypothetical protein
MHHVVLVHDTPVSTLSAPGSFGLGVLDHVAGTAPATSLDCNSTAPVVPKTNATQQNALSTRETREPRPTSGRIVHPDSASHRS